MGRLWSAETDAGRGSWPASRTGFSSGSKTCGSKEFDTPMPEPLGDQLKGLFDNLSEGPMPRRLIDLADALEEAFQKGELHRKAP